MLVRSRRCVRRPGLRWCSPISIRASRRSSTGKKRAPRSGSSPRLSVEPFDDAAEAVERAEACDLLILDAPGGVNDDTLAVARTAHLIVQPTGPSLDDLYPTVLLFHELVAAGIPKSNLVAALCRVLDDEEEAAARAYLEEAGYEVLEGSVPESLTYRVAHNRGRSLTETNEQAFNERADALIEALLTKVAAITSVADEAEEPTRMPKGGAA